MPADTVIGVLKVDETGAVDSVNKTTESMDRMGNKSDELARKVQEPTKRISRFAEAQRDLASQGKRASEGLGTFVAKLFDVKGAMIAVAGSIGLVFILLQVGLILRDLTTRVLDNIEGWKTFKTTLDDAFHSMVLGEATVDRLNRKMKELAVTAQIGIFGADLGEQIENALALRGSIAEQIAGTDSGALGAPARLLILKENLREVDASLGGLLRRFEQIGGNRVLLEEAFGPLPDTLGAVARTMITVSGAVERAQRAFGGLGDELRDFTELGNALHGPITGLGVAFNDAADGVHIWREETLGMTDALPPLIEMMEQLDNTLTTASLQFEVMVGLANQFASSVAGAFSGATLTFKTFVGGMLRMLGTTLLAWGALAVITSYYTGHPGFPVAFATIAAGVAALAAGAALGGGGAAAPQPGTQAVAGSAGGGRITPNVAIFVEGSLLGTSREELARQITQLVREGQADGVALA